MEKIAKLESYVFPSLNALFTRLDPSWDDGMAAVLLRLVEANQLGHICLPIVDPMERCRLLRSPLVGEPGHYAPFILDTAGRLYFARDWYDETVLATHFSAMAARAEQLEIKDSQRVQVWLERLFPGAGETLDRQKVAAALAVKQRFLVISGGPGTGKTTTVVRLLILLIALSTRTLAMAMAAPTGKAAARLTESVALARRRLSIDESLCAQLPAQAVTLHRLLGRHPGQAHAVYHRGNPLPLDVLVIDEASMIDQYTMARTVEALPAGCRLILLGDRDQLMSVEAGAVFGELCQRIHYRVETQRWLNDVCGGVPTDLTEEAPFALSDSVVLLTQSYRFDTQSGIGALACRVNAGQGAHALAILNHAMYHAVGWLSDDLEIAMWERRRLYLDAARTGQAFDVIQQHFLAFMMVTVERQQVYQINRSYETLLEQQGWKVMGRDWYLGRPVMITENEYSIGLFNGDIGFTVEREGTVCVAFPSLDGTWRTLSPGRLPAHETVYAMTVHKSQGSEYDEVWLMLPDRPSRVFSRALIYTAVTRARHRFYVVGHPAILEQGIRDCATRWSGLSARWVSEKS